MPKQLKLATDAIKPLAIGHGRCLATDHITVEGHPVRFMYREVPENRMDSGWRFMSGFEDETYMDNLSNHGIYDVNTIANYDPSIIPFLTSHAGHAFERPTESEHFLSVAGWPAPEEP
jgi:hypothetical protein